MRVRAEGRSSWQPCPNISFQCALRAVAASLRRKQAKQDFGSVGDLTVCDPPGKPVDTFPVRGYPLISVI